MSTLEKFMAAQPAATQGTRGATKLEATLAPEQAAELAAFTAWMKGYTTMTAGSVASYRTYYGQMVKALDEGSTLEGPEFRHVRACGKKLVEFYGWVAGCLAFQPGETE